MVVRTFAGGWVGEVSVEGGRGSSSSANGGWVGRVHGSENRPLSENGIYGRSLKEKYFCTHVFYNIYNHLSNPVIVRSTPNFPDVPITTIKYKHTCESAYHTICYLTKM
jgi:hypothetical protein